MASLPTTTEFLAYFPQFGAAAPARVQLFIDQATSEVPATVWGTNTKYARALLAAHMIQMADRAAGGGAGPITSSKVGDLARSYGQVSRKDESELTTTGFGLEFLRLRRQLVITPMVTGCD